MRRKTFWVVVLMAVLATTGLAVVLTRSAGAGPFGDPQFDGCCGNVVGGSARPGQIVAIDYPLSRTLSTPVVLLAVRLLHPEDAQGVNLRYGARANDALDVWGRTGWRLRAWHARPLAGFVIPAHHHGTVEIGYSSRQRGMHHIRGFIIDYRIGGTTYSAPQSFGIDFCVGKWPCRSSG